MTRRYTHQWGWLRTDGCLTAAEIEGLLASQDDAERSVSLLRAGLLLFAVIIGQHVLLKLLSLLLFLFPRLPHLHRDRRRRRELNRVCLLSQ